MALDLLGLGVSMLRCLAGSAVGFVVSKGIRSAASESGGSIRAFLQKDIDQIREKVDSLSQSKLSAALQNVRQGLILLDQQFSVSGPISCSPSTSELESAVSLCVTSRTVLAADAIEIPAEVCRQFELAQQLAIEAFHDKRNVPAMLRVECLNLQLFCSMLIHYQQPERWLGLWTVILEESMKDKELATAAASACEFGGGSPATTTKSALAVFWRKSNPDLSQAMHQLVENLHCALMAALWHPNVDARVAFGRSRILQYPRLLLCRPSINQGSQQPLIVKLEAPFLYPWRADRIIVVLPSVFKLVSLYPTNKLLTAQYRTTTTTHSNSGSTTLFSLKILDVLTLTEDEMMQVESGDRLLDIDFDRKAFNILVLLSTAKDGLVLNSYNLQFDKNLSMKLAFSSPCSQVISDPLTGSVITFDGTSVDDEVYVLKNPAASNPEKPPWFSYENIFKCMLSDRPGSIRVSYTKPFRQSLSDESNFETGLELLLYNRFTDVVYSLVTSFGADEEMVVMAGSTDCGPSSTSSIISSVEENMTKIQQIYPLKTPLLKVRVFDNGKSSSDVQKVMLEKGAIFEHDHLAEAKEKCLASAMSEEQQDKKSPREDRGGHRKEEPVLVGALVSNDESSALHVFDVLNDDQCTNDGSGMRFKTGDQAELPLHCEQWENRYLGGVVCFGKFIFVGTLMCKMKICDV